LKEDEGESSGEDELKPRRGPKIDAYEALDKFTINLNSNKKPSKAKKTTKKAKSDN
jgi:hypothetical protein